MRSGGDCLTLMIAEQLDIVVETIDVHYDDIESLENVDATNMFRCGRHIKCCALENVLKLFNQWTRFQSK